MNHLNRASVMWAVRSGLKTVQHFSQKITKTKSETNNYCLHRLLAFFHFPLRTVWLVRKNTERLSASEEKIIHLSVKQSPTLGSGNSNKNALIFYLWAAQKRAAWNKNGKVIFLDIFHVRMQISVITTWMFIYTWSDVGVNNMIQEACHRKLTLK